MRSLRSAPAALAVVTLVVSASCTPDSNSSSASPSAATPATTSTTPTDSGTATDPAPTNARTTQPPPTEPDTSATSTTLSNASVPMFRFEPDPNGLEAALEQFNALGRQGSTYIGPLIESRSGRVSNLFVKTSTRASSVLDYVAQPGTPDPASWVTSANIAGAEGYLSKGPVFFDFTEAELFVRDVQQPRRFQYEAIASASLSEPSEAVLAELNMQGARGFRWIGQRVFGLDGANIYTSDNSGVTYAYDAVAVAGPLATETIEDFLELLNQRSSDGATFLTALTVNAFTETVLLFESASASAGPVSYFAEPVDLANSDHPNVLAAINQRATAGELFWGDVVMNDLSTHRLYVSGSDNLRHPLTGPWYP